MTELEGESQLKHLNPCVPSPPLGCLVSQPKVEGASERWFRAMLASRQQGKHANVPFDHVHFVTTKLEVYVSEASHSRAGGNLDRESKKVVYAPFCLQFHHRDTEGTEIFKWCTS